MDWRSSSANIIICATPLSLSLSQVHGVPNPKTIKEKPSIAVVFGVCLDSGLLLRPHRIFWENYPRNSLTIHSIFILAGRKKMDQIHHSVAGHHTNFESVLNTELYGFVSMSTFWVPREERKLYGQLAILKDRIRSENHFVPRLEKGNLLRTIDT